MIKNYFKVIPRTKNYVEMEDIKILKLKQRKQPDEETRKAQKEDDELRDVGMPI